MSPHQKVSIGIFIVIGTATFVLGLLHVGRAISDPLRLRGSYTFKSAEDLEQERTEQLRAVDTDGDTLSDYDELYVFRTSPFLEDTDSDGTGDGKEIAAESDPNCPQGKSCRQANVGAASSGSATASGASGSSGAATGGAAMTDAQVNSVIAETFGDPSTLTPEKLKADIEAMSSTELRVFLGKLGLPSNVLQQADDVTLRQLVLDTMSEITVKPATP